MPPEPPVPRPSAPRLRADPAAIAALFRPRSVAVLGASANPERFGGRIVPTLLRQGFAGAVYPVNPARATIAGLPCYPTLAAVPGDVDCVVCALAADAVAASLRDAAAKSVRLVVLAGDGFAERGDAAGRALQAEVLALARAGGIRLLGPNCIGFANFVDRTCVSASAILGWPDIPAGRIGLVSQSGGLGLGTAAHDGITRGIGFSHMVNTGSEADLDVIDVARFLVADPDTDVVAITCEAIADPDGFVRLAREAGAAGKPIVALKSGRSALGKALALSHTGALAGSGAVFEAVCRQFGVAVVDDVDALVDLAALFAKLRRSGALGRARRPGAGVAAMSISGGHVGLFADHAARAGLAMPAFAADTTVTLAATLALPSAAVRNPLDTTSRVMGADAVWGRCVAAILEDPAIAVAVVILVVAACYETAVLDILAAAARSAKVAVVLWAGGDRHGDARALLRDGPVPVFASSARTVAAIAALDGWCRVWGVEAAAPSMAPRRPVPPAPRAILLAAREAGHSWLGEHEGKRVLAALGVPVTAERMVTTADEAAAAAAAIGTPVALKGAHAAISHKSEAGLVRLALADEAAVRAAFADVAGRLEAPGPGASGVLVQAMVPPGIELILGLHRDPECGLVVLLGLGGIFAEVLDDATTRLPPFDHAEARRMIGELRGHALLAGARGRPPVDAADLADLLVRLGDFAVANRDLVESLDLNPLIASDGGGFCAADALIVLRAPGGTGAESPGAKPGPSMV